MLIIKITRFILCDVYASQIITATYTHALRKKMAWNSRRNKTKVSLEYFRAMPIEAAYFLHNRFGQRSFSITRRYSMRSKSYGIKVGGGGRWGQVVHDDDAHCTRD